MQRKPKSPKRRAIEQFFIHIAVALLVIPLKYGSLRSARRLAVCLAHVIATFTWHRQRLMEQNLIAVFGDKLTAKERKRIRRDCTINICKTMVELMKLQWMSAEELISMVNLSGMEHIDNALAKKKGVIMVTAHYGNWEWGGAYVAAMGYPTSVIARDANDPLTRELVNKARESKGIRVYGRADVRELLRALKNNEVIAILPDQHAKDAPVRVKFLGRVADTASGPATLAMRTGAAVVPAFVAREPGDNLVGEILPPIVMQDTGDREADIIANVQRINDVLGDQIRKRPDQWLWLHDRWKAERFELEEQ